jgi:two-component system phosphate regulon response regulator PhoB
MDGGMIQALQGDGPQLAPRAQTKRDSMAANILVVEDEPAIQELIAASLARAGYLVERAADAQEAYVSVREAVPDLILLDWMMPGMSGIDLARRLRAEPKSRSVPIIMLTARSGEHDRIAGLESGADDYITKPFSPRELLARIAAVLRRGQPASMLGTIENNGLVLDPAAHRVTVADSEVVLGPVEFRLLHFLMAHAERAYSRAQLLDQVWGGHALVDERTVDVHIHRLRATLRASGRDGMIQTVRGSGYRFTASAF